MLPFPLQPIRKQAPAAGSMAAAPAQWGLLGLWGVIWRLMTTLWELFWPSTKRPEKEREDYNSEEAAGTKTPKDDWKHSTPETARGNGRGNGGALLAQLIDSGIGAIRLLCTLLYWSWCIPVLLRTAVSENSIQ